MSAGLRPQLRALGSPAGGFAAGSDTRVTPPRVLIPVPQATRDLEGLTLVAHHLARMHGVDVRVCATSERLQALFEWAPDAILLHELAWREDAEVARTARRIGTRVAVLPTSAFWPTPAGFARMAGRETGANACVDAWLAWGPWMRDELLAHDLLPHDRIHVTGCPRFDLHAPRHRGAYAERAAFARATGSQAPDAPVIAWLTGTYFNHVRQARNMALARLARGAVPLDESERELADDETQFRDCSAVIAACAERHPEWQFVIGVHPGEQLPPYDRFAARFTNVRVVRDVPTRHVLACADVIVQRWSTVAVEAWLLHKPVLDLAIGHYHAPPPREFRLGNSTVRSVQEAERAIAQHVAGGPLSQEQLEVRREYLDRFLYRTDFAAAARAAHVLACLVTPDGPDAARRPTLQARAAAAARDWDRRRPGRVVRRVKNVLGLRPEQSLRFWLPATSAAAERTRAGADHATTPDTVARFFAQYDALSARERSAAAEVVA